MAVLAVMFASFALATSRGAGSVGVADTAVVDGVGGTLIQGGLPLRVNDRVDAWIDRLIGPDRASFEAFLVREGLYGGMIRERLGARGMPEELLYLAMIESGFSATATSKDTASGVWQFMGETAKEYGLVVNEWVDERRDPVRATEAALDYLEKLYATFGSWYLAAAAYNAGPTRVSVALARHGSGVWSDEEVYWEISEHLPRETRDYVPKMLAATIIAQRPEHFGFDVVRSLPYLFERVYVPGGTALSEVAVALGVDSALIRELNPHLIRGATPPGQSYLIRVPLGDSHRLVASLDGVGD
jgi:membrane-bound lytic murein transglycosylase D